MDPAGKKRGRISNGNGNANKKVKTVGKRQGEQTTMPSEEG